VTLYQQRRAISTNDCRAYKKNSVCAVLRGRSHGSLVKRYGPQMKFLVSVSLGDRESHFVECTNTSSRSVTFPYPAREPARPTRRPTASADVSTPSSVSISARQIWCLGRGRRLTSASCWQWRPRRFPAENSNPRRSIIRLDRPLESQMTSTETSTPWGIRDALIVRRQGHGDVGS